MVRLLIIAVGAFLIWVLFISGFTRQRKITITAIAVLLSILGVWLESSRQKPKTDIVRTSDVISCGISAKHSYRTNFDLTICLQNNAANGHVKRIKIDVIASQCITKDKGPCVEQQRVERDIAIDLKPGSAITINENLNFSSVATTDKNIVWTLQTKAVKATQ